MKTSTAHKKYATQVRSGGRAVTPYRIGFAVGAAGDSLPSPYPPGTPGDLCYLGGMERGQIEAKARELYVAATANDLNTHRTRHPTWLEVPDDQRWPWREMARKALATAKQLPAPDTRKPWERSDWTCARARVDHDGMHCPEDKCADCPNRTSGVTPSDGGQRGK